MKNIEKYYYELNSSYLSPNCHWKKKIRNEECDGIPCKECGENFLQWLNEEYKETIKLTSDEKAILKNLPKEYKWIVRNKSLNLYVFKEKPSKSISAWLSSSINFDDLSLFNHLFKFIKFEDKEPYSIEELLNEN